MLKIICILWPVPVRESAVVTALVDQVLFKGMKVLAVPTEEVSVSMNHKCLINMSGDVVIIAAQLGSWDF